MILGKIHPGRGRARRLPAACRGFTIAEIVLALGILSVAVVAILGLLAVSATTSRESDLDTMLVSMTAQVTSDLRSAPFEALWFANPKGKELHASLPVVLPQQPEDSLYYFTADGVLLSRTTPDQGALYQCTVKKMPDEATRAHGETLYNLLKLHLHFQWPAGAPHANRNAKSIYTTIARY